MRSPKYLDVPLLRTMADFYDIPVPHDAQVTRKVVDSTGSGVGIDKVAKAHRDRTATEGVVEVYQSELRPVKLFNDIVDELVQSERASDLTFDPAAQIVHRNPVLVEGELEVAGATEVGEILGKFIPLFVERVSAGATDLNLSSAELANQFFNGGHEQARPVMRLEVDGADYDFYMVLNPEYFVDSGTDELIGDLAVFGLAERIIREGSSYSLEKYMTPGFNRTLRRMLDKNGAMQNLLKSAAETTGRGIDLDDLNIRGPAVLLKVAGIFT